MFDSQVIQTGAESYKLLFYPDAEAQHRRDVFLEQLDEELRRGNFHHDGLNLVMDIPDVPDVENTRNSQVVL